MTPTPSGPLALSIVIPAYREERKVGADVAAASGFLAAHGLCGEVLVVDDGSPDGTRVAAESAPVAAGVERRVLSYARNRGKGFALRTGMVATRGRVAMFADSGVCIPFEQALRGLRPIEDGTCDVAHASRYHPGSHIARPPARHRRVLSRIFRFVVPRVLGLGGRFTDTQCGFKLYRGDLAREVFAECTMDGFMIDVEVALRCLARGCRFAEFPVDWTSDRDSRFPAVMGSVGSFRELLVIRRSLRAHRQPAGAPGPQA